MSIFPMDVQTYDNFMKAKMDGCDLKTLKLKHKQITILVHFISYQTNKEKLERELLTFLTSSRKRWTSEELKNTAPIADSALVTDIDEIISKLLRGGVSVYIEGSPSVVLFGMEKRESRALEKAETESLVLGPQLAFTESLRTNLNVVRWRIHTNDLHIEKFKVGKRIPTEVRLIYMKSLANEENVDTCRQRIKDLEIDTVEDTTVLGQMLEDSSLSIFPQILVTELPSRFCHSLEKGRIGILVDKSPTSLIAPMSLFSFFESTEDTYMRWNMGSFIRMLRFVAMFVSVLLTPLYVAALSFHYEVIPASLLVSLGQSRATVPFPPVFEALLLELLIELLREAGARLPTKVGQTMGIVGGIVLGQAAVQAGFTSNILIIIVALSALASFTAPSYLMGTAIRIIRFPMIILAGMWGFLGTVFGLCFLIIHLLKVTSLGRPYLAPLYPFEWKDLNKSLFRLPPSRNINRPYTNMPKDTYKANFDKAKAKKDVRRT
ncbi:spore germination protein [Salimicrobium halophilum]|uniref:GerA spore germination protein n=1 Tax=Salimicrobium halophilum TaxID=86666 RepID=A0A1G8TJU5_9BACI|nr:spore germination protein [Salimicrobium halophilum]SDJ41809.1 GerA spore germination protein [Salimicrobium halophilum]